MTPVHMKNCLIVKTPQAAPPNGLTSRNIPNPIKREVRQRCGFGCVICGMILYDYDHMMNDWSQVQEHVADDITLLCTAHHREKTNGLLTREQVAKANKNPFNLREGSSKPYDLHFDGEHGTVVLADNIFTNHSLIQQYEGVHWPFCVPVLVDGIPLIGLRVEDGRLLFAMEVYNEFNEKILAIYDNQMIYSVGIWDVTLVGKVLTIREGQRDVILQLEFRPPSEIAINKAKLRCNGVTIEVEKDHFVINGNRTGERAGNALSSLVGISVGPTYRFPRGAWPIDRVDRYR